MEELELTFLPRYLPEAVKGSRCQKMVDVYLPQSEPHPVIRARCRGESYEITKKVPVSEADRSYQTEQTISLTEPEWREFGAFSDKKISKVRYFYREAGYQYEIDVFDGELKGLVLIDVEFAARAEMSAFSKPEWLLADVTQERFIAGGELAGKRYVDIAEQLKSHHYQPPEIDLLI